MREETKDYIEHLLNDYKDNKQYEHFSEEDCKKVLEKLEAYMKENNIEERVIENSDTMEYFQEHGFLGEKDHDKED